MDIEIQHALAPRRLGTGEGKEGRFSVQATEALLAVRTASLRRKHAYLAPLLRICGRARGEGLFRCEFERSSTGTRTSFRVTRPGLPIERLELRDFLSAAIGGEIPPSPQQGSTGAVLGTDLDLELAHLRRRLAEAINALLATGPEQLSLSCAAGCRIWQRRASPAPAEDPYVMSSGTLDALEPNEIVVTTQTPAASFGARLTGWLVGADPVAELADACSSLLGVAPPQSVAQGRERLEEGILVAAPSPGVALGTHAHLYPELETRSCFLVRDGVRLLSLDHALASDGIAPGTICGSLECDALALTIDGDSVVRDGNLELLVAWLREYLIAGRPSELGSAHGQLEAAVHFADGRVVERDRVLLGVLRSQELIVAWPWERDRVPHSLRPRVALLMPSQFTALRAALPPDVPVVRLAALGQVPQLEPFDFESLLQGCLDPLALVQGMTVPGHPYLQLSITAYVHRYPAASRGRNVLIAFGRRIADNTDESKTMTGVTVVCRIATKDGRTLDELRSDRNGIDRTSALLDDQVAKHRDAMIAHVISQTRQATRTDGALRPPLWTACVEGLSAAGLRLRYSASTDGQAGESGDLHARDAAAEQRSSPRLRLAWDDAPSLALVVGRRADGSSVTLREALVELRQFGFLIVATSSSSAGLPTDQERARAITLDPELSPAVGRVIPAPLWRALGDRGLGGVVSDEPSVLIGLLRTREEIVADLAGALGPDERARERLLGHLLAARILHEDEFGLASVPMLLLYDPRALAPTRLVSLEAIEKLSPRPGLAPIGTSDRRLPASVVEVGPLLGSLLHQVAGMIAATHRVTSGTATASLTSTSLAIRRTTPPLAHLPIRDPMAVGSIRITSSTQGQGIALWQDGVHIRNVVLAEPLQAVSGRLWIARDAAPQYVEVLVLRAGVALIQGLIRTLPLQPPGSVERERAEAYVLKLRSWLATQGERLDPRLAAIRSILQLEAMQDPLEPAIDRTLRSWPLRPPRGPITGWLGQMLTHSLGVRLDVSTAMLSWKAVRVLDAGPGFARVEFGLRHSLVHASVVDGDRPATYLALPFAVADYFQEVERVRAVSLSPTDRHLAYWRSLAQIVTQEERTSRRGS